MDYIINTHKGAMLYAREHQTFYAGHTNLFIMKTLCMKYLTTYEGYIKAIQQTLHLKYKIPIVLSDTSIWVATQNIKSYDNIWVNMANIMRITKHPNGSKIYFISGLTLITSLKPKAWQDYMDKLEIIKRYKIKTLSSI